ncbi:unnamed protein product [Rotaria sp. Silwood2]|nr:unnamed protein product [Rotaria sp. Silwood2]CAF2853198.1 unnamed protein product [Rotaria sp. Silwood2]CAF4243611.1 unnamed protein product [Rotaria sp. Silwood2]CAF4679546.1 unnamed protein product [Rotaria sp. Silwood2]
MASNSAPFETVNESVSKTWKLRSLYLLVFALITVTVVYPYLKKVHNPYIFSNSAVVETNGILRYMKTKLSATSLEYFDDINSVPGTTGPGIPKAIRSSLLNKYGGVDTYATMSYGAATGT